MNVLAKLRRAAALFALAILPLGAFAQTSPDTIELQISNWKFSESTIVLHVNQRALIHITTKDGVHEFESPDLGIAKTRVTPGDGATLDVTPKNPGTYVLHCELFCGAGHLGLALTVKVEA